MGFKQNILQLDIPICHAQSAWGTVVYMMYVLVLLSQHKVQ